MAGVRELGINGLRASRVCAMLSLPFQVVVCLGWDG